jgi:hypothetical protein
LRRAFINGVSGIVNRGSPFAGNVDGGAQRADNFEKAWAVFGPAALAVSEGGTGQVVLPSDTSVDSGAVAGGVIGGLFAAVGLAGGFILVRRRRANSRIPTAEVDTRLSARNPTFTQL